MNRFSKTLLAQAATQAREALLAELGKLLTERLSQARDFHKEIEQIINELRSLGHDLWSYDETDDFEEWGPDYTRPANPGIMILFTLSEGVSVTWLER